MSSNNRFLTYYPVFLNINDKLCVVIGGGQVALRKVESLLECGAAIKVISPDLCTGLNRLVENGKIDTHRRCYRDGDLNDAHIIIVATDDRDTNREVVKETNRRAILVNVVDDADNSSFIVPSIVRRGDITIAVSTAGRSPALARKIKTRLENNFGDEFATLALIIDDIRREIKRQRIKINSDAWQDAIDLNILISLIKSGDIKKAKDTLLRNLKVIPRIN